MTVKFEGDFDITNLEGVPKAERAEVIQGAIASMILEMPEEFLDIIFQHDIIIEEESREIPKVAPAEGHFGFYTGR